MAYLVRSSFKPLYYQLSENLRAMIEESMQPDQRLPSENELMALYDVSRNTVRMALDTLEKQGLIYRMKGKGTFVASERMRYGLYYLTSFTEEMIQRGMRPSSKIVSFERTLPKSKVMQNLQLQAGQEVFAVERLRMANDEPYALTVSYIPCHMVPNLESEDLAVGSLYEVLENKLSYRIKYAEQVIKPTVATEYEAELLGIERGSPLLLVEGITFLLDGVSIEYYKLLYRGDRYEFTIRAQRRPTLV